jgi:cytochrome c oxidase subunit 4
MTTVDATEEHAAHDAEHVHEHPSDGRYVIIALILAGITALEVAASYIDIGPIFLPALLGMMTVKFLIVVRMFMHLKFDNRVFSWLFYTGLLLALAVYLAALFTFRFFES